MSELNFNELKERNVPPVIEGSAWEGNVGMALEPKWFPKLSVRAGHVMFGGLKAKTFGDLLKLDAKTIAEAKNSGKKTVAEIIALRDEVFENGPTAYSAERFSLPVEDSGRAAGDFGSMEEMIVSIAEGRMEISENAKTVMRLNMGLLGVLKDFTLESTGLVIGITRERVRQIAKKIEKKLFLGVRPKAFVELHELMKAKFAVCKWEMREEQIAAAADKTFGWTGTTGFSVIRFLEYCGEKFVRLPNDRGWGWNADGRFDWAVNCVKPTLTELRRDAIKAVLESAGTTGLTVDEIVSACHERFPNAKVGAGNVRGKLNAGNDLDDHGTRMIGYDRGTKLLERSTKTRYVLNTAFRDERTISVLQAAGKDVRAYMERTGFGVVSVWKIFRKYRSQLPIDLPKLGFYMMMRDVGAGGLEYKDYPKISYPGMDVCESVYGWELYEYFTLCKRPTATFAQIMSFFIDCLGLQPNIALSCAFASLGLRKVDEESDSPYAIRKPSDRKGFPNVLLGTVKSDPELKLLVIPEGRCGIKSCYLDEDGRALNHTTYARLFFRALKDANANLPQSEIACLQDRRWCKVHLKAYHPVLLLDTGAPPRRGHGYWMEKIVFNGVSYYVSNAWDARNKCHFDRWASRISVLTGVPFEPYDIIGLTNEE